ncbi:hypothetical protein pb186bvf_001437 [Paramecium bursaria]
MSCDEMIWQGLIIILQKKQIHYSFLIHTLTSQTLKSNETQLNESHEHFGLPGKKQRHELQIRN